MKGKVLYPRRAFLGDNQALRQLLYHGKNAVYLLPLSASQRGRRDISACLEKHRGRERERERREEAGGAGGGRRGRAGVREQARDPKIQQPN